MSIEAHWNETFADYVNRATLVVTDGRPLCLALRLLYGVKQERIAGMDFTPSIIEACEKSNLSVFLFGSSPVVLENLNNAIRRRHRNLKIAGSISPPFREFSAEEAKSFTETINNSGANVVLVGMGCPKQETWMARFSNDIHATLLGVGGAFSVYSGLTSRAPRWMQKLALEWLFRLIQEPRRMWRRYLVTNTLFIALVLKQFFLIRTGLGKNGRKA